MFDVRCKGSARMWELGFEMAHVSEHDKPLVYTRDFGPYTVMAAKRSGSTTLKNFGAHGSRNVVIECWCADEFELKEGQELVVVLRDPLERYWSGLKRLVHVGNEKALTPKKLGIIHVHVAPWLHHIQDKDFKVIDFNKFGEYFDEFYGRKSVRDEPPPPLEDWFPFQPEDFLEDTKIYNRLIEEREQLKPDELKQWQ